MKFILENIKSLRILRNITQSQLAVELNISVRQYNNLETGKSNFSLRQLITIASVLQVKIPILFSDDMLSSLGT